MWYDKSNSCSIAIKHKQRVKSSPNYGLAVAQPICRDDPISRWWLQSIYLHFHGNVITREQMLASKSTSSSLQSLPQSAVVIAMCSNYFKVANLKRLKVRIVHLLSSSTMRPFAVTRYVQCSKQPPIARNSLKMVLLSFALNVTETYLSSLRFLQARTEGAEHILPVGCRIIRHTCAGG